MLIQLTRDEWTDIKASLGSRRVAMVPDGTARVIPFPARAGMNEDLFKGAR